MINLRNKDRWLCRLDIFILIVVLSAVWFGPGCSKRSKDPATQQQRAIETLDGQVWYDSEKNAFRPPKVSTDFDDSLRRTGWEASPKPVKPAPAPGTGTNWGWTGAFGNLFSGFVWFILGVVLIGLAVLLASTSMRFWGRTSKLTKSSRAIQIDPTRVVDLPFDAQEEMQDPLEAAKRMANDGDYDSAVLFLYGYMLLALDRAGKIALHRGKTNRMYLFELGSDRTLRDLLSPVMLAFEDVFFGRHSIDRSRFVLLWRALDEFHRQLEPAMAGHDQEVAPA